MKDKELEELAVGRRNLPDGLQVRTFYVDELEEYIAQERRKAKIEVIEKLKFMLDRLDDELAELKEDKE